MISSRKHNEFIIPVKLKVTGPYTAVTVLELSNMSFLTKLFTLVPFYSIGCRGLHANTFDKARLPSNVPV